MHHRLMENTERRRHAVATFLGVTAALGLGLTGCANQYRPVVSAINPVGPAGQPTKFAYAVASPSPTGSGLLTIVDFSGDTVIATPAILPNPTYFAQFSNGAQGFAINQQNSLSAVPLSNPQTLITSQVIQTALPVGANPPSVSAFTFGTTARILIPEIGLSQVAIFNSGVPALQQQIAVGANPVYVVGSDGTPRAYVISNGTGTTQGQVAAIEASSLSVSATIPVGIDPVYGVETTDDRRAFILNSGSGTVNVINVVNNALDNANPVIPATGTLGQHPVWADIAAVTNELVVVNAGDGIHPGSLSIINIPLCNALAQPTNPSCNPLNPVDGAGFGTVIATVPVGVNPQMVSVLADGSRAYVVNQGNAAAGIEGSVSVVNLTSNTVSATIPAVSTAALTADESTSPTSVYGHPNTIAVTNGTPTGKVYITSSDNRFMTVLETDTDIVDTHINLQGLGVRVRVSGP